MAYDPAEIEMCGFCLQTYTYEMQYRCPGCDAPVCPMCIGHVAGEPDILCPDCRKSGPPI